MGRVTTELDCTSILIGNEYYCSLSKVVGHARENVRTIAALLVNMILVIAVTDIDFIGLLFKYESTVLYRIPRYFLDT